MNSGQQVGTGADAQKMMAYDMHKKDMAIAYVLWYFTGVFGGHRFYMGQSGSAAAMLTLTIVSIPLFFFLIGIFTYLAVLVWWIVDAFILHEWVKNHNYHLMHSLGIPPAPPYAPPMQLPEQGVASNQN